MRVFLLGMGWGILAIAVLLSVFYFWACWDERAQACVDRERPSWDY